MSWKTTKLESLCKMHSGGTPSRGKKNYYSGDIPWAKISDIETAEGGVIYNTEEKITEEGLNAINNRIFEKGTLLLAMYGSVGKVAFAGTKMSTNQAILGINIKDTNLLDYSYLKYWFQTIKSQLLDRAVGGTLQNISLGIVKDLEIPLPPVATQKRIAEILDAADGLRRKDQELLKKYDELAQAIFIDMFGDPVKNEKGWELKQIKTTTNIITYGLTVRPNYIEEGIPLISARELRNGFVNYKGAPKISYLDFSNLSKKCKPQKGDILFSKTGSIGLSAIVDGSQEFAVTQNAARINFKIEFYEIYFIYALLKQEAFISKCVSLVKGNAVKDLQLGDFSEIEIICPPLELQIVFSKMILHSNELVRKSKENNLFSDSLFNTLIQKAFNGELVS